MCVSHAAKHKKPITAGIMQSVLYAWQLAIYRQALELHEPTVVGCVD